MFNLKASLKLWQIGAVLLLIGLSACQPANGPERVTTAAAPPMIASGSIDREQPALSEAATATESLPLPTSFPATTTPQPSAQRTKYELGAIFDYPGQTMTVRETVFYLNTTGTELDHLLFVVDANWASGVFSLDDLTAPKGGIAGWELERGLLRVRLSEPLELAGRLELQLDFRLKLPTRPDKRVPIANIGLAIGTRLSHHMIPNGVGWPTSLPQLANISPTTWQISKCTSRSKIQATKH